MAILLNGNTCYDAWRNTCQYLILQPLGDDTNLMVTVSDPCNFIQLNNWINDHNPRNFSNQGDNIRHVINTIFPYNLKSYFNNRQDFYAKYAIIYGKSTNKSWGTYFQRLISFGKGFNANHPNQLEKSILSLSGNSPQRYFITLHLTASNIDSNVRPLGGPCWQFGEFVKNPQGNIDLVVVYRNHDYFNKALGNYIGLAKLLEFVCVESNKNPGSLIVHSIHGYSSVGTHLLGQII